MVQLIRERTAEKESSGNNGSYQSVGSGGGGYNRSSNNYRSNNNSSGHNQQVVTNPNPYGSSYDAYSRGYYDAQYRAHYDAYMNQASGSVPPSQPQYPLTGFGSTATPTPPNIPPNTG